MDFRQIVLLFHPANMLVKPHIRLIGTRIRLKNAGLPC